MHLGREQKCSWFSMQTSQHACSILGSLGVESRRVICRAGAFAPRKHEGHARALRWTQATKIMTKIRSMAAETMEGIHHRR